MNELETRAVLTLLYAEIGKPLPDSKVMIWAEMVKPVPFALGMEAAKQMLKVKFYGEPQFSEYRLIVNRLAKAARRAARGLPPLDRASLCQMNPDEREAFLAIRKEAEKMPQAKAVALLAEIDRRRLEQ